MEMKSTPVSAISRTFSRSTPPEASRVGPPPAGELDGTAQRPRIHVVEQQAVGAGAERIGGLVEAAHLDLDGELGMGGAGAQHRLGQAAGQGDVVLLDQDRVVEPEPVVGAATGGDGGLLEAPKPWRGLAGVEDAHAGAGDRLHESGGLGGDAREVPEEVQRRALGHQQRRRGARRHGDLGGDSVAPLPLDDQPVDVLYTALAHRLLDRRQTEGDARLFLHDPRPCTCRLGHRRLGGHVARTDVLGQGAGDDLLQRLAGVGHRASLDHDESCI
jgi:hypothetical protein